MREDPSIRLRAQGHTGRLSRRCWYALVPTQTLILFKACPATEKQHLWTTVLRSPEEPALNRSEMQRLARAARAHTAYLKQRADLADSDDDDGPQDDDAWLFEDLSVLAKLYTRLREKEDLIALIFEVATFLNCLCCPKCLSCPGLHVGLA